MTEEATGGPSAAVTKGPVPQVEVEILDGVSAFIEGKKVEPGKRVWVDGPIALHLVSEKAAKITGSR